MRSEIRASRGSGYNHSIVLPLPVDTNQAQSPVLRPRGVAGSLSFEIRMVDRTPTKHVQGPHTRHTLSSRHSWRGRRLQIWGAEDCTESIETERELY